MRYVPSPFKIRFSDWVSVSYFICDVPVTKSLSLLKNKLRIIENKTLP